MLNCDYQINVVLDCIKIYADLDNELLLTKSDVKRLDDYINTQNEKIKQLKDLIHYLNRDIVNLTEEISSIEL